MEHTVQTLLPMLEDTTKQIQGQLAINVKKNRAGTQVADGGQDGQF